MIVVPCRARRLAVLRLFSLGLVASCLTAAPSIQPFLDTYCIQCHGPETKMADRTFESLGDDLASPDTRQQWREIVGRLNLSTMPPRALSSRATKSAERSST